MKNFGSKQATPYDDPGVWKTPNPVLLRKVAMNNRFAFISTEGDYNRKNTMAVAEGYRSKGFKYVQYFEQPGGKHEVPAGEWLEKGIEFLDAPILGTAPKDFEAGKKAAAGKRLDQALPLLRRAAARGRDAEWVADAKAQATEIGSQYETAYVAIEQAVESGDTKAADLAFAKLRKDWPTVSKWDIEWLTKAIKDAKAKEKK
jgi:hypothetical protein